MKLINTTNEVYKALVLMILVYLAGTNNRITPTIKGKQINVDKIEWYIINKKNSP